MRYISFVIIISSFIIFKISCRDHSVEFQFLNVPPSESGVTFSNDLSDSDSLNIIQYLYFYNGSGVAVGDVNGDRLPDLFFGSNQGTPKLYLNETSDNGAIRFKDITTDAGLDKIGGWSTGINMTDVNGDGKLDIYICQVNHKAIEGINQLYINIDNQGDVPFFEEQGEQYGLNFQGLSTQSAFFDYDLDGDLDMYLLNHSVHSPENYAKAVIRESTDINGDRLYRNDGGRFIDVTRASGIYSSKIGFGLGLGVSDVNNDGYTDIYIGNDFHENDYLYLNNGESGENTIFKEVILESFGHTSQFSMGLDMADINNDGLIDILTMDMMPEEEQVRQSSVSSDNYEIYQFKHDFGYHHQLPRNNLQINQGVSEDGIPHYSEIGQLLGMEATDWSWSGLLGDYNNDGFKDLFVTNGIVKRPNDLDYLNYLSSPLIQQEATDQEIIAQMPEGKVANYLFENTGDLAFVNMSNSIEENQPDISTGAAFADLDRDGDLDIITNNINTPASILINQNDRQNFVRIYLKGSDSNTMGLGAKISVHAGADNYFTERYNVRGFMSSSSDDIVIGVGDHDLIDSVVLSWSGGGREVRYDVTMGEDLEFNQEDAILTRRLEFTPGKKLFSLTDSIIHFRHRENRYIDANTEKLIPWLLSTQGPALAVGDVNGDGKDDIYIGGARGQSAELLLQEEGGFIKTNEVLLLKEAHFEDVDALFFDIDSDGDKDLYIVSGGNEQLKDSPFLLDRLYVNDGAGNFERNARALPLITENGSSVSAADFDEDGDLDLAIGALVLPQTYGFSKGGNILLNDGKGKFKDVTGQTAPALKEIGMITDIEWGDIDGDGDYDIVIAGEWMPITIMVNDGGIFKKEVLEQSIGLWRNINLADIDADGHVDILAGNFGTNSFIADEGLGIVLGDFDSNARLDPLIYHTLNEQRYPVAGKDLLTNQMNFFKNLHKDYRSFSTASFDEMFAPVMGKKIKEIAIEELETCWFRNTGDLSFEKNVLPEEAQFAPVFSSLLDDFDGDGKIDILLGGNYEEVSPYIGRIDASYGLLMQGSADGFVSTSYNHSGILWEGQVRHIDRITINQNEYIIIARNNNTVQLWKTNAEGQ